MALWHPIGTRLEPPERNSTILLRHAGIDRRRGESGVQIALGSIRNKSQPRNPASERLP
jgi:hypothetical protein